MFNIDFTIVNKSVHLSQHYVVYNYEKTIDKFNECVELNLTKKNKVKLVMFNFSVYLTQERRQLW